MTILLLDGYNLLFRSFASLPSSIRDADGRSINAVYGMLAAIVRMIRELDPSHIAAAFDEPETPTFRHRLYAAYQAQRGPLGGEQAEEFRRQVEVAMEALPRLGVPALSKPGYEADDVLGTLAVQVARSGNLAILVSTDRDLLQLVGPGVEVLPPGTKAIRVRDEAGVRARLGIPPHAVPTFKALAGDASDNIPGVRGIGSKTAIGLVDDYGDLDSIYENLERIPTRTSTALARDREAAYLFRDLATIVTDLPLPVNVENLPRPELDAGSRAGTLLTRLGYRSS